MKINDMLNLIAVHPNWVGFIILTLATTTILLWTKNKKLHKIISDMKTIVSELQNISDEEWIDSLKKHINTTKKVEAENQSKVDELSNFLLDYDTSDFTKVGSKLKLIQHQLRERHVFANSETIINQIKVLLTRRYFEMFQLLLTKQPSAELFDKICLFDTSVFTTEYQGKIAKLDGIINKSYNQKLISCKNFDQLYEFAVTLMFPYARLSTALRDEMLKARANEITRRDFEIAINGYKNDKENIAIIKKIYIILDRALISKNLKSEMIDKFKEIILTYFARLMKKPRTKKVQEEIDYVHNLKQKLFPVTA